MWYEHIVSEHVWELLPNFSGNLKFPSWNWRWAKMGWVDDVPWFGLLNINIFKSQCFFLILQLQGFTNPSGIIKMIRRHTHTHIYIHTYVCVYIYMCIYIYMYAYACIPLKLSLSTGSVWHGMECAAVDVPVQLCIKSPNQHIDLTE